LTRIVPLAREMVMMKVFIGGCATRSYITLERSERCISFHRLYLEERKVQMP
jgi:hypothetical protein